MFFNSYICLFFLIPFFYILPLRSNDTWINDNEDGEGISDDDIAYGTFLGLLITGIGLIFIVFGIN